MAHESLHEPESRLSRKTVEIHRAILSLMEELEAVDWYRQRADACRDKVLRSVLTHNMNEELEHASMVLEWLRRQIPELDHNLKKYLFKEGPIED